MLTSQRNSGVFRAALYLVVMFESIITSTAVARRIELPENNQAQSTFGISHLSLVNVLRDTAQKLERHEYRERNLGEQVLRLLRGLSKKSDGEEKNMENIAAILAKMDERLKKMDESLMQRDERERIQLQKMTDRMENLKNFIDRRLDKLESTLKSDGEAVKFGKLKRKLDELDDNFQQQLGSVVTEIKVVGEKFENQMVKIEAMNRAMIDTLGQAENVEAAKLKQASANLVSTESKWRKNIQDSEIVLAGFSAGITKMSENVAEFWNHSQSIIENMADLQSEITEVSGNIHEEDEQEDMKNTILDTLQKQHQKLEEMESMFVTTNENLALIIDMAAETKTGIAEMSEETALGLETLKADLINETEDASQKMDTKVDSMEDKLSIGQKHLSDMVAESSELVETLLTRVDKGYDELKKEIQGLSNVESVLLNTADNVLDTKRRIEYGIQQILLEVGEMIEIEGSSLNSTFNRRFDTLSTTILANQTKALTNMTAVVQREISQVWRQIGVMYQQVTQAVGMLETVKYQTQNYVNSSIETMGTMDGKVGHITNKVSEVDDNLNYLLGRLTLVTEEFNMIKSELANAMEVIRDSFASVLSEAEAVTEDDGVEDNEVLKKDIPEDTVV